MIMMINNIIKIKQLKCHNCGYEWYPRITREGIIKTPKVCTKCKSRFWNRRKQEQND